MKIGIVNDLAIAMESLRQALADAPEHQIIWEAYNGLEAVKHCAAETPDLILMDLMMPVMDGVEATKRIMQKTPCPILIVTATVDGHSSKIFEAMGVGALDVVATPVLDKSGQPSGSAELLKKITNIGRLTGNSQRKTRKSPNTDAIQKNKLEKQCLLAIGCSTGGPNILVQILSSLPKDFPATIVVIQHMDEKFTPGLVSWLDSQTKLPVRVISEGDMPQPGIVQFACTDHHLILTPQHTFKYTKNPADNFYHPSVDVFFDSISKNWQGSIIGVLLTGMGRDGAEGLLTLRHQGWHTIAQDEKSSIVYGMPKAAAQLGAATEVLAAQDISPALIKLIHAK